MGKQGKKWDKSKFLELGSSTESGKEETPHPDPLDATGEGDQSFGYQRRKDKIMLIGQYESKIDEKGRIALPKRFRESLGGNLIATKGFENSLIIVSESEWETLLEGTRGRPFIEYETRDTQRFLLGQASEIKLDSKGRLILPPYLRTFAGITRDVIFLGLSRYIEVWSKSKWEKHIKELEGKIEGIAEHLSTREGDKK